MTDELKYDDASIDYYKVLGVQPWSSRKEVHMAFRKRTVMPQNSECNSHDLLDGEKIELLKRAKKVLTSSRLKKEYDTKRANKIKSSNSVKLGAENGRTTSFDEWINTCSDTSRGQLSDSDLSSDVSSTPSGGIVSEKIRLVQVDSESEGKSSERYVSECRSSEKISYNNELEILAVERMKSEKKERMSKWEKIKNYFTGRVLKEPLPTSVSAQDQPRESLSKKRKLSSSPSCAEKASELKSTQKIIRRKRKKKKKKRDSVIKRIFQKLR